MDYIDHLCKQKHVSFTNKEKQLLFLKGLCPCLCNLCSRNPICMASMVTRQYCSFLQITIQPQKDQPLEAYSKASLKSHKGKERKQIKKKTNQVHNQTLYCSASPVKTVKLLQNTTTNKLIELIISSHGQYVQIQPPAKVLGHLSHIREHQQRHITGRTLSFSGSHSSPTLTKAGNRLIEVWGFGTGF